MSAKANKLPSFYLRKNVSLAWPLALNALLMQSMLIIDILLVSPLGELSLAAMGMATTVIAFFLGLQVALGNGSQLIFGRLFGAKNHQGLTTAFASAVVMNVLAAVLFIGVLLLWSDPLVSLLTSDDVLALHVHQYLAISQFILLVNALAQVIIVFLNGQGNTTTPFKAYAIELPFNAIISYLLIFGMPSISFEGLGVAGAAYGSLASVILRLAFLLSYIIKLPLWVKIKTNKQSHTQEKINLLSYVGKTDIYAHIREVMPVAANFLVLSVGNTLYLLLFSQLSIYSYVAVTLVFPWLRIATQFIVAWAQANAISITQAIGRNKLAHITPIIQSCIKVGAILSLVVAGALYVFSTSIDLIYPKIQAQTIVALASIAPLYVALPLLRTYNTIAGNSLRALGKSVQVLNIHFIAQWLVVLPLCSVFVLYLKLPLFWAFALIPFEEAIKAVPFYLMLRKSTQSAR